MFSDTLETARAHLEPGSQVIVQVEATMEADQLKLLGRSVAPIDSVVGGGEAPGLRIWVEEAGAVGQVAGVLDGALRDGVKGGKGPIMVCLMDADLPGEVEIDCGGDWPVTPQIRAALRSLEGVIEVAEL